MQRGDVVAGKYRIVEQLGEGGFGAVFRADGPSGTVALKLLHLDALLRDEARSRFRREARLAQSLEHPHLVRILDVGETEDGVPFIAFELLRGRSLDHVLAAEGRLDADRAAEIARQAARGLIAAHAAGIVHRDVKPANLFLVETEDGAPFVKVLDFGIARVASELASQSLTREGTTVGTPAYMSPEQVLAEPLDGRADVYSLGLTLAECLSGRAPYRGLTAMRIALEQASAAPVPLPPEALALPLGPIVERATRKARDERLTMEAFVAELDRASPPRPSPARAAGSGLSKVAWGLLALGLAATATTAGLFLRARHVASRPATASECPGGSRPEGGCALRGRDLKALAGRVATLGYVEAPIRHSNVIEAAKGDEALVVLISQTPFVPRVGQRPLASTCWGECYFGVTVAKPGLSPDELDRRSEAILEELSGD
jgi:predicted Ser/Thr protein kinase